MMAMDFEDDIELPNRWVKILSYLWKIFTCLFLHLILIAIVVAYCFFGAYMFERLERDYEKQMKRNISYIRGNITEDIWLFTNESKVLEQRNWTMTVRHKLKLFEDQLVWCMRKGGWDGNETEGSLKWTQGGALFYSIIVITTIGYGHIAPKTAEGKIATIFYAVVGIPLMLLCLSNIGDVMAHSFRFLYWRICCYKCTQPPKRLPPLPRRSRSFRGGNTSSVARSHGPGRFSSRSHTMSPKRQCGRNSQRSADSAIGLSEEYTRSSYSDTECRYYDESEREHAMLGDGPEISAFNRPWQQQSTYSDNVTMYNTSVARQTHRPKKINPPLGVENNNARVDNSVEHLSSNSPVLFNKYALDREQSCRIYRKGNNHEKCRKRADDMPVEEEPCEVPPSRQNMQNSNSSNSRLVVPRFRPHRPHSLGSPSEFTCRPMEYSRSLWPHLY